MKDKAHEPIDWLLYERSSLEEGFTAVCGVDEAGRGPLAGPVFAAAVILAPGDMIDGINDSKKLSVKKRELLFDVICDRAVTYAVAAATEEEIDRLNILQATFLAMRRAVSQLDPQPDLAIIDGNLLPPELPCTGRTLIHGDALCASIACASILAKVARDRYMIQLGERYPQYGFAKHKGYGTAAHIAALREHGASPVHRRSFLKKIEGIPS